MGAEIQGLKVGVNFHNFFAQKSEVAIGYYGVLLISCLKVVFFVYIKVRYMCIALYMHLDICMDITTM